MQKTPNENQKNDKKYIEISLGAIITVIIVIALVIGDIWLGIHAYKLKNQEENTDNNSIQNTVNE